MINYQVLNFPQTKTKLPFRTLLKASIGLVLLHTVFYENIKLYLMHVKTNLPLTHWSLSSFPLSETCLEQNRTIETTFQKNNNGKVSLLIDTLSAYRFR